MPKIPAIIDFNHICLKFAITFDSVVCFMYPDSICKRSVEIDSLESLNLSKVGRAKDRPQHNGSQHNF